MKKASTPYLYLRNDIYYFRMVVPPKHRADFGKREIFRSLDTTDYSEAITLLGPLVDYYKGKLRGDPSFATEVSITALKETAKRLGGIYRHVDSVVAASIEDTIQMTGAFVEAIGKTDKPTRVEIATAGGVEDITSAFTMRQALSQYATDFAAEWGSQPEKGRNKPKEGKSRKSGKTANKFNNAVNTWEAMMGTDVDILKLSKKEVYRYRTLLLERRSRAILPDGKRGWSTDTIKKNLTCLRLIVRHIYDIEDMKDSPFENLRPIKSNGDEEKRQLVTEDEVVAIRMHFEDVGANDELVAIMAVIENTGSHAAEIVFLEEADIILDDPIPHLWVRPNSNRSFLKTDFRVRKIPLTGIALSAMRRHPKGFPRYCVYNGSENLSAAANKLMKKVCAKTTYGYRHRMAQLMKKHQITDTLRESIMGWSSGIAGHYGEEYPLDVKLSVLKQVLPAHAY